MRLLYILLQQFIIMNQNFILQFNKSIFQTIKCKYFHLQITFFQTKISFYSFLLTNFLINLQLQIFIQDKMSSILSKIKAAITILRMFYWITFIAISKSFYQVLNTNRSVMNWSLFNYQLLKFKLKEIKSQYKLSRQKTIYLINHRSQADFFVHTIVTNGLSNFIARRQVALMFGFGSLFVQKCIWFFKRTGIDIQKFNSWLDRKFQQSPLPSLVVYPQGHRMYDTQVVQKQKVKRGMIKYAFTRNIPVQIIITFGNQHVFNQKKLLIGYGQQVKYKIGKTINPQDFKNAKQFVDTVVDQFIKYFNETLSDFKRNAQSIDRTQQLIEAISFKAE